MALNEIDEGCGATWNSAFCVLPSTYCGSGRWLTPDPLGGDITNPQSLNRYAYALNNPTALTDPSGLDSICPQGSDEGSPPPCYTAPPVDTGPFDTNPADPCAYAASNDASCGQAPGLWPNGQPIYPPGYPGGGGSTGSVGSTTTVTVNPPSAMPNGPLNGPSIGEPPGFASTADVIEQVGPYATPYVIEVLSICALTPGCQEVLLGAAAGAVVYIGVQEGIKIYQARKRDIRQFDDALKEIQRRCGRPLSPDEQRQLRDEIHGQGLGYNEIVQWGVDKFCPGH